jgi:hypothetical protein
MRLVWTGTGRTDRSSQRAWSAGQPSTESTSLPPPPPVATLAPASGPLGHTDHFTMEPNTCSRSSWADEVEEEESARGAGRCAFFELPPLAVAVHASFVLWASSLDPDVEPLITSPGGYEERLHFTDLEASFGESDAPLPRQQRRHPRRRVHRGSLLRNTRRSPTGSPPLAWGCLASVVVHCWYF